MKRFLPELLILSGLALLVFAYGPIVVDEVQYRYKEYKQQEFTLESSDKTVSDSPFARLLASSPILIEPVNTDFALVIEKIGVNAPVVRDVPVSDEDAYIEALKNGIAHASTSPYPSEEPGNVYLFAHSASFNFWRLGEYAQVFNLLRKLEKGDNINVFYEGNRYMYEVINNEIYKGFNTYPLKRATLEPILTLQTCDPPGTTLNRLVVTAQLKNVQPVSSK